MAVAGETTDWGQISVLHWQGQPLQVRRLGHGSDPPLVLIHGFAAAAGHWRANAPAFAAAGWRVYGLDLLGFGASPNPFWCRTTAPGLSRCCTSSSSASGSPW